MKLLIDTHTYLWMIEGDSQLSDNAASYITDPENHLFLSCASVWELGIKISAGKLSLSKPLDQFVSYWSPIYQVEILPITVDHVFQVQRLQQHHKDPFDRMIIAQTIVENMQVISIDQMFDKYPIVRIW